MADFTNVDELLADLEQKLAECMPRASTYEEIANLIAANAKSRLGQYQQQEGIFPAWSPLAPSTQDERERLGYARDEPLLRDGTLRDAIKATGTEAAALVAVPSEMVPSDDGREEVNIGDVADYLERGTPYMPPRPFLGPALLAKREEAMAIVRAHIDEVLGR